MTENRIAHRRTAAMRDSSLTDGQPQWYCQISTANPTTMR